MGPGLRLTALHLLGFKSFADKIELRFGPGVTAIVGPNGSGKSNIVDAVRWVLGEQNSRSLRSARVTNLIFAGTERRKPLGMAQATLALDNSEQTAPLEYSEINIVRRVYRSGDSEFLINGTPCRLRDIQQLLLGTGLGRGGMAVVGQGEIDAILSAQPHDRRLLLEETAGTSRYRAQQRIAEQRLERARQDLARVHDLAYELTGRVETLTKQAATAARYKEVTAALQEHRATRAARDWSLAVQRQREAEQRLTAERQHLHEAERTAAKARSHEVQSRTDVEGSAQRLEDARARLQQGETAVADASHRLELLRLQWRAAEERMTGAYEQRVRSLEAKTRAETQLAQWQATAAEEQRAIDALQATVAQATATLSSFDAGHRDEMTRLESLRTDAMQLLQMLAQQRNELGQVQKQLAAGEEQRVSLDEERCRLEEQRKAVSTQYERARVQADARAARVADGKMEEQRLAASLRTAREQLAVQHGVADDVRSKLHEVQATKRALGRLEQNYAGYRPAVKAVLAARPAVEGVLGTVAQLIDVPARLDVPVQVALGAATQFLIMTDERSVQQAIEYLRSQRAGRATFLALDSVRPRSWPREADELLNAAGVVGRALDLISFEPRFRGVIEYLLGRTVIVEQLPRAQQLARGLTPAVRLVTLQGDLLTPGGPVTGGSQAAAVGDGMLSRRRELRALQQQETRLDKQLQQLMDDATAATAAVQRLEQGVTEQQSAATTDAIDAAKLHQAALQAQGEMERLDTALAQNGSQAVALAERLQQDAERIEGLQTAIAEAEGREGSLQNTLHELTEQANRRETDRRGLADKVGEHRAELAARTEALRGLHQRHADLTGELKQLESEVQRLDAAGQSATAEGDRLQVEIDTIQRSLPGLEEVAAALRAAVTEAIADQKQRHAERAQAEAAVQKHDAATASAKERVWATEAALARHESAVEGHAERLRELDIGPEKAQQIATEDDAPRRDIRALEEELEAIGAVHLGAEDELREIEERLQFLQEQQVDLERAIASLVEVIERLDKVSEERFATTLERVAQHFDDIFRRLFGGGRGQLHLSEEEDGVDVHVQMPGKRPQNLLALSGGERALTAIALLFAILRVQPSPFYLLDEIDSALDEANLGRFQRLLREAAQDAQFIVITHRATTMEVADTLYGVTAAEPGVSTLISLDLQAAVATIA